MSMLSLSLSRRIACYLLISLSVFAALNVVAWFGYLTYKNHFQPTFAFSADPAGPLPEKKAYYLAHKEDFNALFLGDSRTLCGMHPDFIDPTWGRTSYNLSHWATWMPTQYALISDIVDHIPKDTVVVWSVGHKNFEQQVIRAVYPPGWRRLPFMISAGYASGELINAQLAFTPLTALIGRRDEFFEKTEAIFSAPMAVIQGQKPVVPDEAPGVVTVRDNKDVAISYVEPWYDDHGLLVSEGLYKLNGAMARREINSAYYRAIQARKDHENRTMDNLHYEQASMVMFKAALEKFRQAGIRVVINEMEEAPFTYLNEAERQKYRDSFRTMIAPIVKEYGFTFVAGPAAQLGNADYFDYNHLNEAGARRYDTSLARVLKRVAP